MSLRVGVIGAGFAGSTHARACLGIEGVVVAAITAEPSSDAAALAAECGARLEPDAASLCAAGDVDLVIIASPTDRHAEHALAAAGAGKHVFSEKPLARTLEQGRTMIDACARAGVSLAVGQVVRFFPEYRRAAEAIHSGALGRPALATLTRGTFPVGDARPWYLDPARSGRVVLDLMLHDLDTVRWWFGEPARVTGRIMARDTDPPPPPGLDYALATLGYDDGPIVHLEASWAEHDGFRTGFEVRGSDGLLSHDSRAAAPLVTQRPAQREGLPAVMPATTLTETPYRRQLREVTRRIVAGEPQLVDGREGLRSLALALTVLASAECGETLAWEPPA